MQLEFDFLFRYRLIIGFKLIRLFGNPALRNLRGLLLQAGLGLKLAVHSQSDYGFWLLDTFRLLAPPIVAFDLKKLGF